MSTSIEETADKLKRQMAARALVTSASVLITCLKNGHKVQLQPDQTTFRCAACQMEMQRIEREWIGPMNTLICPFKDTDKVDIQFTSGTVEQLLVQMSESGIVQLLCNGGSPGNVEWEAKWSTRAKSTVGYGITPMTAVRDCYENMVGSQYSVQRRSNSEQDIE